jgi:hypothetical protein
MLKQLRKAVCSIVFLAAIATVTPSLRAQNSVAMPGSTAFEALPSAIAPAASAIPAAYSSQTFSTVHIPETSVIKPLRVTPVETAPSFHKWLALAAVSSGAAAFDAYSTRRSLASGNIEDNPLIKPFAGSPAVYVAIQASPVIMDLAALKMQHSRNSFLRHMWWMPQTAGSGMSIFAGVHNMSISN